MNKAGPRGGGKRYLCFLSLCTSPLGILLSNVLKSSVNVNVFSVSSSLDSFYTTANSNDCRCVSQHALLFCLNCFLDVDEIIFSSFVF